MEEDPLAVESFPELVHLWIVFLTERQSGVSSEFTGS